MPASRKYLPSAVKSCCVFVEHNMKFFFQTKVAGLCDRVKFSPPINDPPPEGVVCTLILIIILVTILTILMTIVTILATILIILVTILTILVTILTILMTILVILVTNLTMLVAKL